jgi:hypothetical protein
MHILNKLLPSFVVQSKNSDKWEQCLFLCRWCTDIQDQSAGADSKDIGVRSRRVAICSMQCPYAHIFPNYKTLSLHTVDKLLFTVLLELPLAGDPITGPCILLLRAFPYSRTGVVSGGFWIAGSLVDIFIQIF